MKHLILGTAGHIDHGKTSLVKALTGIDTDRLPEEKARGITIELGFAHLKLSESITLGIVDVPGHEKFVRTMVAGVGGMDMVMLVIAADEGIMPQTREHLDICGLLGIRSGLVALSKQDMVDSDWIGLVTEEIRDYLATTFLHAAPIIPVSARTGQGIDDLRKELLRLSETIDQKRSAGTFRLPVDRVFSVPGFGTVATGTLLSGRMNVGEDIEILPTGISGRVRTLQVHGTSLESAEAGQRVAVNLQGIEHARTSCGDIITPLGAFRTTRTVDVSLSCLASAPKELKHRSVLRLHSATFETQAQLVLLDRNLLKPGETAFAQLRLAHPVLLLPNDPFILRAHSPQTTVAGGRVLDPFPPARRRRSAEAIELLACIETGDEAAIVSALVSATLLSGATLRHLLERTGFSAKRVEGVLSTLLSSGELVQVLRDPRTFVSRSSFEQLKTHIRDELAAYCAQNPLKNGISKEELKTRIPKRSDQRFFSVCLAALEKEGKVLPDRELVKPAEGLVALSAGESDIRHRVIHSLESAGIEPPTPKDLAMSLAIPEKQVLDHLNLLARTGLAIKVKGDLFYHPGALEILRDKLVAFLSEQKEITPAEFRELTGLSRKFMIPVLEYFDAQKLTIRIGDKRIIRGSTA
jgi:selenocysteine-specific elongation factor